MDANIQRDYPPSLYSDLDTIIEYDIWGWVTAEGIDPEATQSAIMEQLDKFFAVWAKETGYLLHVYIRLSTSSFYEEVERKQPAKVFWLPEADKS